MEIKKNYVVLGNETVDLKFEKYSPSCIIELLVFFKSKKHGAITLSDGDLDLNVLESGVNKDGGIMPIPLAISADSFWRIAVGEGLQVIVKWQGVKQNN